MPHRVTALKFLTKFNCLGADCPDTCCVGWNMQLTDKDYEKYKTQAPELLDAVAGEQGNYRMRRDAKTDYCVKFVGGLCGIQQKYGEEMLGEACYLYPRATRALGDETVMTAALSCPEIARLSLFDDDAFAPSALESKRLPELKNYLPDGLSPEAAIAIHQQFIEKALDKTQSAERTLMEMLVAVTSLERIKVASWPEAVPFYFEHAKSGLPKPEAKGTDQFFLLQALCGLVVAAKKVHQPRLMRTIGEMEEALHVKIRMDTLAIAPLPDSYQALKNVQDAWQKQYQKTYAPVLSRYLATQLSLALFPFHGFGGSMIERVAVIGIRLATVKLALMCACALAGKALSQEETIRVVQSISRLLDHLAEADFSLQIYNETGWLKKERLRALLGDA